MQGLHHRALARKLIRRLAIAFCFSGLAAAAHGQLFDHKHPLPVGPPPLDVLTGRAVAMPVPLPVPKPATPATVVKFDEGGVIREYELRWRTIAAAGGPVEVRGICRSACTILTHHVPKHRICFAEYSALHFHQARLDDGSPAFMATQWMIDHYPDDIRSWIYDKGGPDAMPRSSYWVLTAEKLWAMGYRKCDQL